MKVSCILPVYNEEKVISNCLNSLLKQDIKEIEIIVVDDGSTDNTVKIINEFVTNNKNVRLFHQKHDGPGSARNLGASNATGKIVVFPDADEEFPTDYVSKLVTPIISGTTIGTTTKAVKINPRSNIFSKMKYFEYNKKYEYSDSTGTKVFRAILRSEFLKIGGFDNRTDYFDDGSLSNRLGVLPTATDAFSYTTMSSNPKEIIFDSAWGVKSNIISGNKRPFLLAGGLLVLFFFILSTIIIYPILLVGWYILFGVIGYFRTDLSASVVFYPIYFISKSIGLYYGIYQGLFLTNKKGR